MFVFHFWIPKSDGCVSCFEQKNYMKSSEMLSKSQISRFPGGGSSSPERKNQKKKRSPKTWPSPNSRSERPRTPHRRSPRCVFTHGRCKAIPHAKCPKKFEVYIGTIGQFLSQVHGRFESWASGNFGEKKSFLNVRLLELHGATTGVGESACVKCNVILVLT